MISMLAIKALGLKALSLAVGIFGSVAGMFSAYTRIITIAGFVTVASVTGVMWWQKRSAENKVVALSVDNDRLKGQVEASESTIAFQKMAIGILEDHNATLTMNTEKLNDALTEIRNAPKSEDAPIAPVLLRALRRLDRLRK